MLSSGRAPSYVGSRSSLTLPQPSRNCAPLSLAVTSGPLKSSEMFPLLHATNVVVKAVVAVMAVVAMAVVVKAVVVVMVEAAATVVAVTAVHAGVQTAANLTYRLPRWEISSSQP